MSEREQPREEVAIALQRDSQVFGRHVIAAIPLTLEVGALAAERVSDPLDDIGNERVGLVHGSARLIDESRLDLRPAFLELIEDMGLEQRSRVSLGHRAGVGRLGIIPRSPDFAIGRPIGRNRNVGVAWLEVVVFSAHGRTSLSTRIGRWLSGWARSPSPVTVSAEWRTSRSTGRSTGRSVMCSRSSRRSWNSSRW